jgi:23S rRNA (uracil1939-C5)-methyltransferase
VQVEKLVYGGDGLARVNGRVVLLPFVLPGEKALAESHTEKPGLVRARPVRILEKAPERVEARCPYFARCGGCHYQHAPYEFQQQAKRAILAEELRRLGKIEAPGEIGVLSAEPFGYRNRAQLHIERGRLGYREARSHRLCAIDHCPISSPRINETIATLVTMLRDARWPRFVKSLEIFTDERQVQLNVLETERPVARRFFDWCAEQIPGLVDGAMDYQVGADSFQVSRNSFFQVNRFLLGPLVDSALGDAGGESALDLYAGVGLFSIPLARRFQEVTAVEAGASAARDLSVNAAHAGQDRLRTEHGTAEKYLESLAGTPDFVLLDPPRAGVGALVVRRLIEIGPPRVTIVSCDPATLARDLAGLLAGGYGIEKITLVDLFPQTYHLETVVNLARR